DRVKLGFVGVGAMGQCAHLRNYCDLPVCDVVALAELRPKTGHAVAQRYGVERVYRSAEEMLASEPLDAIVASQPFDRHGVLLPQLLRAGKPIFIEKPLSSSPDAGQAIPGAVQTSGTWVMVGYHKRSDPACAYALETIRELRNSGELGRMTYIRILMPAGDWVAGGFTCLINKGDAAPPLEREAATVDMDDETQRAYTTFVNYYIHQINLLRFFLEEPYHVTYADPSGVMLAAESESGVPGVIEMSPYHTSIAWQESVLVCFERGYVKVELPAPLALNRPGRVEVMRDPEHAANPDTTSPHLPWVHAMRQQAINFVAAVKGERPPVCSAAEALEDLRVARDYIRLLKGQ
ncbi:MAG: Gfo/Idh/MocA family oxidoreductase, partial [Lentisphaerae bacterium]|nr:Gfo/Idh/MocA family oxidoreductase [Lentisphaerota bacterium]